MVFMGLRELKEVAHQQFVRGKFAQCAQTYQQILRAAPRDPNMRVRHAEACRRAGERLQAVASYRAAAELLLELGCESRARGALKAALELDPRDPLLQADVARLSPQHEEAFSSGPFEHEEMPLLPPLESGVDPVPPPPRVPRPFRATLPEDPLRTTALPTIHRALPSTPSVEPLGPPVLLPAPAPSASRTEKMGVALASAARALPPIAPRSATAGHVTPAPRPAAAPPSQGPGSPGFQPPVLHPVATSALPPCSATSSTQAPGPQSGASPPPRSATTGSQAPAARTVRPPKNVVAPSPPHEALLEATCVLAQALPGPAASASSKDPGPRLEVRRLSESALAFRCSPNDSWAVIRSHTPLEIHLVEDLEQLPPMLCDFTIDITVEPETEAAPNVVH